MAYGMMTTSDISAYIQIIFEDSLFVARDNSLMLPLVRSFGDRQGNETRKNSQYGTAIINQVAETDDLVSQTFHPSVIATLTPAEYAGQYFITDTRMESDPFGARQDATVELGVAMAQSIENNLISNFTSLTAGTVGAAGSLLTWGYFSAAMTLLRNQNAPLPYACVLSPNQYHNLAKSATIAGATTSAAPNFADDVTRRWWVNSFGPVDIFLSSNIAAGTAVYGAMWSRQAMAYDERRAPRLEPERDASRRGLELNLSTRYAHGVWRPLHGVTILSDGSAPTS
jgi:hypothetical protein